jgi:hypothetical protein
MPRPGKELVRVEVVKPGDPEDEDAKLKKLLAEQMLDVVALLKLLQKMVGHLSARAQTSVAPDRPMPHSEDARYPCRCAKHRSVEHSAQTGTAHH